MKWFVQSSNFVAISVLAIRQILPPKCDVEGVINANNGASSPRICYRYPSNMAAPVHVFTEMVTTEFMSFHNFQSVFLFLFFLITMSLIDQWLLHGSWSGNDKLVNQSNILMCQTTFLISYTLHTLHHGCDLFISSVPQNEMDAHGLRSFTLVMTFAPLLN